MSQTSRDRIRQRQEAARDIVERARNHDQVAMGILAMVRDNAKQGNPVAQQSLRAIERYISKNPAADIGSEVSDITNPHASGALIALWQKPTSDTIVDAVPRVGFWPAVVALSHGARLDNDKVNDIINHVDPDKRLDFEGGFRFWQAKEPPDASGDRNSWIMGRAVGLARVLQRIQFPSTPLSILCPATAWELGE